jgi:hypothetical protein
VGNDLVEKGSVIGRETSSFVTPYLFQSIVSTTRASIELVAERIFLVVVLVIILGGIERGCLD